MSRWVSVGLCVMLATAGFGCGSNGTEAEPQKAAPEDECESVGLRSECTPNVSGCSYGSTICEAGSPRTLGPCVCQQAESLLVAGPDGFGRGVSAGAFGAGRFYWSDFGYAGSEPYTSRVFSGPIGSTGTMLVPRITSAVDRMRVTDTKLYVLSVDGPLAFTLSGQPLPDPTREEAFPEEPKAAGHAVLSDDSVLSIDGVVVQEGVSQVLENEQGVYYLVGSLLGFRPIDDLNRGYSAVSVKEASRFWVSGSALYVASGEGTRAAALHYADVSVLGQD